MRKVVRGVILPAILLFAAASRCLAQNPPFFNVQDYGATGDGVTLDSPAVNAAIAAAAGAGGGTVTFPPGNYVCLSIHLTNDVTLYLSNNAVILAAATNGFDAAEPNPWSQYQDYGHSHFHDALIWGENLTNIGFAGSGEIDGNGILTSGSNPTNGQADKAISLVLCTNVNFSGITITRAGHFGILADGCQGMTVLNAQILNAYASQHRDAFNLVDSSDVIVSNCVIQGSDDAMVLKSDYALGRKIGGHNIHIIDCQILSTENNATQFGSETVGDFTDVTFSDIGIGGAGKAGIGITSQDGAVIDGVTYDNVTMTNCACPIFLKLDLRTTGSPNPSVGRIRNISVNNVAAWHSTLFNRTNTSTINGYFDGANTIIPIENVVLNNVNVSNIGNNPASAVTNYPVENQNWQPQAFGRWPCYGWYLRWANDISFTNCQAHFDNEDDRPAIVADTVTNLLLDQFTADVGANNTNYDIGLLRVTACEATNVFASALAPVPGAPLRVFNSNSVSALIASPPFFYPGGGTYTATQSVVIASGTPGAMIHYTTDGSTPAITNGILYSGPVSIGGETVLRAMASAAGLTNSAVNTAIYHFPGTDIFIPPPPPPAPVTNFFYEAETLPYATNGAPAGLQSDSNTSGGHWLALEATGTNEWIEFTTPILPAGVYDLQMSYKSHPDRGILAFTFDGVTWPYDLDQYASSPAYPSQDWGEVTFTNASAHTIRLTVVGENPAATGYWLSVDRFLFYLVQPPQPVFSGSFLLSNDVPQLSASGYPTLPYRVQMTTNLGDTNWITIGSVAADTNGMVSFSDTNAPLALQRFYRLATP